MDKEIVSVEASTFPDGMMLPIAVLWKDGRRFPVEKVLYYSTSPAGEYNKRLGKLINYLQLKRGRHIEMYHVASVPAFAHFSSGEGISILRAAL